MLVCGSILSIFFGFNFVFISDPVFRETGQRETIVECSCGGGSMPSGGFVLCCVETHREPAGDNDCVTGGLMIGW